MNENEMSGRVMAHAFNDELEKIALPAGAARAASHLGGSIARGLQSFKQPGAKGFRKFVGEAGDLASKNMRTTGLIAAGTAGAGLVTAGGLAARNRR